MRRPLILAGTPNGASTLLGLLISARRCGRRQSVSACRKLLRTHSPRHDHLIRDSHISTGSTAGQACEQYIDLGRRRRPSCRKHAHETPLSSTSLVPREPPHSLITRALRLHFSRPLHISRCFICCRLEIVGNRLCRRSFPSKTRSHCPRNAKHCIGPQAQNNR